MGHRLDAREVVELCTSVGAMEISGVPLHPLTVHAAVVLAPLSALVAIAYLVPAWRDHLRWPVLVLALLATGAVWAAYLTGQDFRASARFEGLSGELLARVEEHEELADSLRLVASGFAVVAVVAAVVHRRRGAVRLLVSVLLLAAAVALAVSTVLTGHAGARAVWGA